jgi:plasmid maintenance system antidote protein VapI
VLYEFVENEAMNEIDKDYELNVLKMVINTHLDEIISVTEKNLKSLEANRDRVVWELAAKIYSQSGHKVEFYLNRLGDRKIFNRFKFV